MVAFCASLGYSDVGTLGPSVDFDCKVAAVAAILQLRIRPGPAQSVLERCRAVTYIHILVFGAKFRAEISETRENDDEYATRDAARCAQEKDAADEGGDGEIQG